MLIAYIIAHNNIMFRHRQIQTNFAQIAKYLTIKILSKLILYRLMNTSEPKNGYLLKCLPFDRIYIAVYSTISQQSIQL